MFRTPATLLKYFIVTSYARYHNAPIWYYLVICIFRITQLHSASQFCDLLPFYHIKAISLKSPSWENSNLIWGLLKHSKNTNVLLYKNAPENEGGSLNLIFRLIQITVKRNTSQVLNPMLVSFKIRVPYFYLGKRWMWTLVVKTWYDVRKWQVVVNNSFRRDCAHVFFQRRPTQVRRSRLTPNLLFPIRHPDFNGSLLLRFSDAS